MNPSAPSPADQVRPALHRKIDELPEEELATVERLLAKLEMDRVWGDLRSGMAQDWDEGKYERLDDLIGEVRADLKRQPQ